MPDPRTSPALLQLAEIGCVSDPPTWHWAIARLEGCGRLCLPPEARVALGVPMWLRGGPSAPYLIGTRADTATVVVAPATLLDDLGAQLSGERP